MAPRMLDGPYVLSRPIGIEWGGWRSDTLTLQEAGWRLAVDFDIRRDEYQLIMKNETMSLCAITDRIEIAQLPAYYDGRKHAPIFRVVHMAPDIYVVRSMMSARFNHFEEIDARPQSIEHRSISNMNVFATKQAEQILIDKADMTVIEHLEAIKTLQSPKQRELRARVREDRTDEPRIQLVANLVSYGGG